MTLVAPKRRKTALNSDSLTGQFLEAGRPTYIEATPDSVKRTPPRYLEAKGGELHPPTALHRNVTDAGGLGGLIYTAMMLQYLRYATDAQTRTEQLELISWWQSEYGVRRVYNGLYVRMAQRFPHDQDGQERAAKEAQNILEAVLTCHREQADPADVAERFHRTEQWLRGNIDWCMRIAVRHRQSCQCETCGRREAREA